MTARYITIDRGSINLRARFYQNDHCLDSRQSEVGVTRLNGKSPTTVLAEVMTGWREENTPVVMAGIVGSNVGWRVAPHLSVSVCFSSIGEQLTSVGDNIRIIPRLCVSHDGNHSVMRGEETQSIGARILTPSFLYVMPGTYCRWMQADSQQISDFHIVMIGELHHLLLNHPLIGVGLPPRESAADAFAADLEHGLNASAVLPWFFEIRISHVLGILPRKQVSEFLSGLLIGAEIVSICDYVGHQHAVTLVVGASLTARYQQASQAMGCDVTAVAGDTAFQAGIRSIAHVVTN